MNCKAALVRQFAVSVPANFKQYRVKKMPTLIEEFVGYQTNSPDLKKALIVKSAESYGSK